MVREARIRTRDNPEIRREKIIDEAIRIIGQRGYHGFKIQELAERCGLSNAGLLYHFPSKDQLFVAVVQQMEQREIAVVAPFVARIEQEGRSGARLTAIIDFLHALVSRGSTQPELAQLYAVLQSESLDKEHPAHDSFRVREAAVLDLYTKLVTPYVAEPRSTARQLLALLDGLRLQWLREDQSFDAVAEWVRGITILVPKFAPLLEKLGVEPRVKAKTKATPSRPAGKSPQKRRSQKHRQ